MVVDTKQIKKDLKGYNRSIGFKTNPQLILERTSHSNRNDLIPLEARDIISALQFDMKTILALFQLAAMLEMNKQPISILDGKILATVFFEPSTRTRLSYESAMNYLGGRVISVAEPTQSSLSKGESLADIGQMYNGYADAIVLRHTHKNALEEIQTYLNIPLINAGICTHEHPTQALADWYAICKARPDLFLDKDSTQKTTIGIIGNPCNMRTVKSFLLMSLIFKHAIKKIFICSEMSDPLGPELSEIIEKNSISIELNNDLLATLPEMDIIYTNSITYLDDGYQELSSNFRLTKDSPIKKDAIILHPLARKMELDVSLDNTQHNLYFEQAHGAVFVRKALLISLFGKTKDMYSN